MQYEITKLHLANGLKDIILYELQGNPKAEKSCCWTESYQNGREQGITITLGLEDRKIEDKYRYVTITECRNSDSIVVYKNNIASQGLNESAYKSATHFSPGQYNEVVKFCIDYLLGE